MHGNPESAMGPLNIKLAAPFADPNVLAEAVRARLAGDAPLPFEGNEFARTAVQAVLPHHA